VLRVEGSLLDKLKYNICPCFHVFTLLLIRVFSSSPKNEEEQKMEGEKGTKKLVLFQPERLA
jgi:hypothetical protein